MKFTASEPNIIFKRIFEFFCGNNICDRKQTKGKARGGFWKNVVGAEIKMDITLNEKEKSCVKELADQEKLCIRKYEKYASMAKDKVLCDLFTMIKSDEEKHLSSLNSLISGTVSTNVNVNDSAGATYSPAATYTGNYVQEDKDNDSFLCTDAITTEKYVSSAYNFDLFRFGSTEARKLLADIEVEEQNHAEMMFRYKTVNSMC